MARFVKCRFKSCKRLVGPIRLKVSDICYMCDRNIETWSKRGYARRVEWYRRCNLSTERQDVLPKGVNENDVVEYVRKTVTAALRKKEKETKKS